MCRFCLILLILYTLLLKKKRPTGPTLTLQRQLTRVEAKHVLWEFDLLFETIIYRENLNNITKPTHLGQFLKIDKIIFSL